MACQDLGMHDIQNWISGTDRTVVDDDCINCIPDHLPGQQALLAHLLKGSNDLFLNMTAGWQEQVLLKFSLAQESQLRLSSSISKC